MLRFLAPLSFVLLAGGCAGPLSALDPAGPAAASIALLWWIMFWGAAAIFAGVMTLFTLAVFRPYLLAGISARSWIVHGGVSFSVVVLLLLLTAALVLGERLIARPLEEQPLTVRANGQLWFWQFGYPDQHEDAATRDVLHIPAGQYVDVVVTSSDVIHSFWAPRLGGKIDAVPGHENLVRLFADRPGIYRGQCAEFCGAGHAQMHFDVVVHAAEDYETALAKALAEEER